MHLVINKTESFTNEQSHLDLSNERYSSQVNECETLAMGRPFKPVFGVKMSELSQPVIYGVSVGSGGYSLERCGAELTSNGEYKKETEEIFLSRVIDHIGAIPCRKESELNEGESLASACKHNGPTLTEILNATNFNFTQGKTPSRSERQPALRVETDTNYKLIKFIDPTAAGEGQDEDTIEQSFINQLGVGDRVVTYQPLYFTAFARADKRVDNFGSEGQGAPLTGAFFKNITSSNVRFVIDGSGSMSACVMWGDGISTDGWKTYYDPVKGRYRDSNQNCSRTRMGDLIKEMKAILEELPNNTKIGITAFSSGDYQNNKEWSESKNGLVRIGDNGKRESAIAFVNSLDDQNAKKWGGTDPWRAIQKVFDDTETDTLYLMSDGRPNRDRNGGDWTSRDHQSTAEYYSKQNKNRTYNGKDRALIVNTTSLGLESPWLEKLSELTQGYYNQIDKDSLTKGEDDVN